MTDTGLISEDKEGEETHQSKQTHQSNNREETVVSRKETIRAIERNPEQSISTSNLHTLLDKLVHQHLECISLTLDKQTKTINNEA